MKIATLFSLGLTIALFTTVTNGEGMTTGSIPPLDHGPIDIPDSVRPSAPSRPTAPRTRRPAAPTRRDPRARRPQANGDFSRTGLENRFYAKWKIRLNLSDPNLVRGYRKAEELVIDLRARSPQSLSLIEYIGVSDSDSPAFPGLYDSMWGGKVPVFLSSRKPINGAVNELVPPNPALINARNYLRAVRGQFPKNLFHDGLIHWRQFQTPEIAQEALRRLQVLRPLFEQYAQWTKFHLNGFSEPRLIQFGNQPSLVLPDVIHEPANDEQMIQDYQAILEDAKNRILTAKEARNHLWRQGIDVHFDAGLKLDEMLQTHQAFQQVLPRYRQSPWGLRMRFKVVDWRTVNPNEAPKVYRDDANFASSYMGGGVSPQQLTQLLNQVDPFAPKPLPRNNFMRLAGSNSTRPTQRRR